MQVTSTHVQYLENRFKTADNCEVEIHIDSAGDLLVEGEGNIARAFLYISSGPSS